MEAFHQIEQADDALAGRLILDPRKVKIVEEWLHGPCFELPESDYIRASNLPIAPPALTLPLIIERIRRVEYNLRRRGSDGE